MEASCASDTYHSDGRLNTAMMDEDAKCNPSTTGIEQTVMIFQAATLVPSMLIDRKIYSGGEYETQDCGERSRSVSRQNMSAVKLRILLVRTCASYHNDSSLTC